jgi:hypothetical protein
VVYFGFAETNNNPQGGTMYYRKIESIRGEKVKHDESQKAAVAARLKTVAAKKKAKKASKKEAQA